MKIKIILLTMMLLTSMSLVVSSDGGYEPLAGPNYMGFTEPIKNVTVGDTFYSYIYGDISSEIDTIAVDNLTYLPAGILTYSSLSNPQSKGNLLNASNDENYTATFLRPTTNVSNSAGYANPWLWAWTTITVNNTNATAFNTRWNAVSCGVVTFTITAGGTALGGIDPGTTKYTQTVYVHPDNTGLFTATSYNTTQINLTWNKGTGADRTVIRCSSVSNPTTPTGGSGIYNDTGTSTPHPGLSPGEHIYYSVWSWNATANLYSISYQQDDATTGVPNSPPTFGTPSPTNSSIGQNLALTWSIPINDPDGDTFAYWLNCSNGQGFSSVLSSNGTKSLSLSGLSYSTTYRVWVNATDSGGSGQWTRSWYQFTTKVNTLPSFGTPSPSNGSVNQNLAFTWSISITDPGETVSWTIQCSNSQTATGNNQASGTKSLSISGLSYSTTYRVYVNATDGIGWTRRWYNFTTLANQPPDIPGGTDMTPRNNAPNIPVYVAFLRVVVTDPESQTMDVSFYWGNGTLIGTDTAVTSGSTATISIPNLAYNTTYYWYVSIDDKYGGVTRGPTAGNWTYTTKTYSSSGGAPSIFIHNVYVTVIDGTTNLPIVNAQCKVMKEDVVQGQGLTDIYGTWSGQFKDNSQYTLVVMANGYTTSTTPFSLSQKDVFITVRMKTTLAPVGLTNAQGGLTTLGFIFLAILICVSIGIFYIWYNYYGGKKR